MSGVKVAVRIRPLSQKERDAGMRKCASVIPGTNVVIIKREAKDPYLKSQGCAHNEYEFDSAFDEDCSQRDVYEKTTKPYLKNLLAGLNVTVFAYGATGAGKTHTMMGNSRRDDATDHADAGIIPNSLRDIFSMIHEHQANAAPGEKHQVICSFMEVYNEKVYDLVEPTGKELYIREDQERGIVVVAGIAERMVTCQEEILDMLSLGNKNRKTEATCANQVSSRSHAILQLTLKHFKITESGRETMTESKLNLIDLAGSERASATNNRGVRLQEGANINKSLLALANCINALAGNAGGNGKPKTNVKYRDSKLTHLLKSSLEGNCNLIMIANVNPSHQTYEDSHNTLKYSNRAKNIKVDPKALVNKQEDSWVEREHRLRDENARLRKRVEELEKENQGLKNELTTVKAVAGAALEVDLSQIVVNIDGERDGERVDDNSFFEPDAMSSSVNASFEVVQVQNRRTQAWGESDLSRDTVELEALRVHEEATGQSLSNNRDKKGEKKRQSIGTLQFCGSENGSSIGPRPFARRARRASITSLSRAPSAPGSLPSVSSVQPSSVLPNIPEVNHDDKNTSFDEKTEENDMKNDNGNSFYRDQIERLSAIAQDQQKKLEFLLQNAASKDDKEATKMDIENKVNSKENAKKILSPIGKRDRSSFETMAVNSAVEVGVENTPLPVLVHEDVEIEVDAMSESNILPLANEEEVTLVDIQMEGESEKNEQNHEPAPSTTPHDDPNSLDNLMSDLLNDDMDAQMEQRPPDHVQIDHRSELARANKKRRGSYIPQPKRVAPRQPADATEGESRPPSPPTEPVALASAPAPHRRSVRLSLASNQNHSNENVCKNDVKNSHNKVEKTSQGKLSIKTSLRNIMSNGLKGLNARIRDKENGDKVLPTVHPVVDNMNQAPEPLWEAF